MGACEEYLEAMRPAALSYAARWAARHPLLGQEDLLQEALLALMEVWRKFSGGKGPADLAKLGRNAVKWRIGRVRRAALRRDLTVRKLPLGGKVDYGGGLTWHDVLPARPDCEAGALALCREMAPRLSREAQSVLRELAFPGAKTLAATARARARWNGRRGNWWLAEREGVVARALGIARRRVRACLAEVREAVSGVKSAGGHMGVGLDQTTERGGVKMGEKGFVPDDEGLLEGLPGSGAAAPKPEELEAKAEVKAKPKAKAKAEVKAKPKAKAKAEVKAKPKAKAEGVMNFIAGEFMRRPATLAEVVASALAAFPGRMEKTVTATTRFILGDGHGYLAKKGLKAERVDGKYRIKAIATAAE